MPRFKVYVTVYERYEVEAADEDDARERWGDDGEQVDTYMGVGDAEVTLVERIEG